MKDERFLNRCCCDNLKDVADTTCDSCHRSRFPLFSCPFYFMNVAIVLMSDRHLTKCPDRFAISQLALVCLLT